MCIEYELHPRADVLYYITDIVLPPIIFGVGVAGNLLLLVILSRRSMRADTAIYVFYAAAAGVDLAALCCAAPTYVRDLDLLPLSVSHSFAMAYVVWARRAVEPMLRHMTAWLTVTAAGVRCAAARLQAAAAADGSSELWTRVSASRVVALIIFVACVLLDFTRFLDTSVVELTDHCFVGVRLWSHNVTVLGRRRFYQELQPAVSTLAGDALPVALSLLLVLILVVGQLHCSRRSPPVVLRTPDDDDERRRQLTVTVVALSSAFILLEAPTAGVGLTRAFYFRSASTGESSRALYYLSLTVRCMSLLRCAVNCIIIALLNYDFRKTLRRTFCCCCPANDDVFFEPVVCCPLACCQRAQTDSNYWDEPRRTFQFDHLATVDTSTECDSSTQNGCQFNRVTLRYARDQQKDKDSSPWI